MIRFAPLHPVDSHEIAHERQFTIPARDVFTTILASRTALADAGVIPIEADHGALAVGARRLAHGDIGLEKPMAAKNPTT